ncbi:MAG TPA: hypothetical protein VIL64_00860 [Solirubrobacteraceae bacterium]
MGRAVAVAGLVALVFAWPSLAPRAPALPPTAVQAATPPDSGSTGEFGVERPVPPRRRYHITPRRRPARHPPRRRTARAAKPARSAKRPRTALREPVTPAPARSTPATPRAAPHRGAARPEFVIG